MPPVGRENSLYAFLTNFLPVLKGYYSGCWEAAPLFPKLHLWTPPAVPPPRMKQRCLGGVPGTDAQAPSQLAPVQSQPFPDACRTGGRARPSEAGVRASSVPAQARNC